MPTKSSRNSRTPENKVQVDTVASFSTNIDRSNFSASACDSATPGPRAGGRPRPTREHATTLAHVPTLKSSACTTVRRRKSNSPAHTRTYRRNWIGQVVPYIMFSTNNTSTPAKRDTDVFRQKFTTCRTTSDSAKT